MLFFALIITDIFVFLKLRRVLWSVGMLGLALVLAVPVILPQLILPIATVCVVAGWIGRDVKAYRQRRG